MALLAVLLAEAKVNVQLPVRVAVNTLPSSQSIVMAVPVLPRAVTSSENAPAKNVLESIEITVAALAFWIPAVTFGVVSAGLTLRTVAPVPVEVVAPVPPLATASVPARVIVPEVVTGPPDVVRPVVPPEIATLVTVPPASVEDRVVSEICSPDPTVRNLVAPVESSQKNIRCPHRGL